MITVRIWMIGTMFVAALELFWIVLAVGMAQFAYVQGKKIGAHRMEQEFSSQQRIGYEKALDALDKIALPNLDFLKRRSINFWRASRLISRGLSAACSHNYCRNRQIRN